MSNTTAVRCAYARGSIAVVEQLAYLQIVVSQVLAVTGA